MTEENLESRETIPQENLPLRRFAYLEHPFLRIWFSNWLASSNLASVSLLISSAEARCQGSFAAPNIVSNTIISV
jgi:hypothetical protein